MTVSSETLILYLSIFAIVIASFGIIFALFLFRRVRKYEKTARILFSGKGASDLETVILDNARMIRELDTEVQELFEISNSLNVLAQQSIHKIGVVRFNPFKDIGGNQSVSIALLDGKKTGLILTVLHTREGTRVYAKPVVRGNSGNHPLTNEERQAITVAGPLKKSESV